MCMKLIHILLCPKGQCLAFPKHTDCTLSTVQRKMLSSKVKTLVQKSLYSSVVHLKNQKNDTCDKYQMILKSPKIHTECLQEQVGEGRTPFRFG